MNEGGGQIWPSSFLYIGDCGGAVGPRKCSHSFEIFTISPLDVQSNYKIVLSAGHSLEINSAVVIALFGILHGNFGTHI